MAAKFMKAPYKTFKTLPSKQKGAVLLVSVVTLSLLALAGLSTVEQTVVQERTSVNSKAADDATRNAEKGLKQAVSDLTNGDVFTNGFCTENLSTEDPGNWECEKVSEDGYTYVVSYIMNGDQPATDDNGDTIYKVSVVGVRSGSSGGSLATQSLTAGVVVRDAFDVSDHEGYLDLSAQCQGTYDSETRQVTFCHATGSSGHKLQTANINGWLNGHKPGHGPWSDFCALDCSGGDPGAPPANGGDLADYAQLFYTRGDVDFVAGGGTACEQTGTADLSSSSEIGEAGVECAALESSSSEEAQDENGENQGEGNEGHGDDGEGQGEGDESSEEDQGDGDDSSEEPQSEPSHTNNLASCTPNGNGSQKICHNGETLNLKKNQFDEHLGDPADYCGKCD